MNAGIFIFKHIDSMREMPNNNGPQIPISFSELILSLTLSIFQQFVSNITLYHNRQLAFLLNAHDMGIFNFFALPPDIYAIVIYFYLTFINKYLFLSVHFFLSLNQETLFILLHTLSTVFFICTRL